MWKSTPDQYGRVAIAIHWVSALLIVALLVSGFRADATADAVGKITVLRAHAAMGITILILTLARIAWWRMADRKPPAPEGTTNSQHRAAQLVHVLFYVVILGMAVSGIGMLVLSGAGAILFGGGAGPLPDFETFLPRTPHGIGARLMLALFALHAGAALYHHFIRRDGLLRRMGIRL
ncbi:MAG: cytochrome b [Rhodospirillaceae bacterium]|mgnify:CR=1 FL=1|jgi:cytochrome b561|nr:cytochrome b [Rhodospirillaceae bacterium]MBT3929672.1 cytochrome b [Rhodospirillaceae bacterium]MBT4770900.1 cytochrome b [Rhodospirillaceae bacterium]MBT5358730.1 cytochrome b [Rhodospirillaceae bacterium]MBT5769978.1 cytochrome b [Rhodospirillaceae bacterium]